MNIDVMIKSGCHFRCFKKMSRELTSISSDVFTGVLQGGWCMSWKTVWEILAVHVAGDRCPIEGKREEEKEKC